MRLAELVAETMVTLGMSSHTDRMLRLMVEPCWLWQGRYRFGADSDSGPSCVKPFAPKPS